MAILEPTQKPYKLRCTVNIKDIEVKDQKRSGEEYFFQRKVCYLIPEKNDQGVAFLNAWLPEESDKHFELALHLPTPIDSPCRGAICRANKDCQHHHIYVMSKGIEDDLIKFQMDGKLIIVDVLPENDEDEADDARDSGGDFDIM